MGKHTPQSDVALAKELISMGGNTATRKRRVPAITDMDDETFFKHYNLRHLQDVGLARPMHYHRTLTRGLIDTYRAYHERIHLTEGSPDHVHLEAAE